MFVLLLATFNASDVTSQQVMTEILILKTSGKAVNIRAYFAGIR
jgi:hypothetical protein